jgi:hypothetical protein
MDCLVRHIGEQNFCQYLFGSNGELHSSQRMIITHDLHVVFYNSISFRLCKGKKCSILAYYLHLRKMRMDLSGVTGSANFNAR